MTAAEPDAALATAIAERIAGERPTGVRRFTTGARHFVFEATFADRKAVVVRIGDSRAHAEMEGSLYLSGLLRGRGVPLPEILAAEVDADLPWLVMERLPGSDLWEVMPRLSDDQLDQIAAGVVAAQAATGTIRTAGRYGYAAHAEDAPHGLWSRVIEDNLVRSRGRIVSAGLFDPGLVDTIASALAALRDQLDGTPATPFLHDTTTKNVIVTAEGTLSGIVDVDDLCFGDPRYPAALTLAALMGYGGPAQYVSAWLKHAGAENDRTFRLYVAVFLLDLMGEHGQVFNGNQRPSDPNARAKLLGAFRENLPLVTA